MNFLDILLGQEEQKNPLLPNAPGPISGFGGGTYDPQGHQVTPKDGAQGALFNSPVNSTPSPAEGDDVMVSGWKPHHRSTLGTIADILLGAPLFANRIKSKNMQEAMEGFTHDPLTAIQRMAQIPGQQGAAWKLYNEYKDNERGDMAATSLADSRKERFMTRKAGLLRQIQNAKDPTAAYAGALPILQRLSSLAGDSDSLPAAYDENYANNYVSSSVTPEDQIRMEALAEHRKAQRELGEEKLDETKRYHSERLEDFDAAEQGRNARNTTNEQGRNERFDKKQNPPPPTVIDTPQGPMMVSPDGAKGRIGNTLWLKVKTENGKDQWKRVK